MKRFLTFLSVLLIVASCDDGYVITVQLDFPDTFETCGELVFFTIKEDPSESLSIQITSPALSMDDVLETEEDPDNPGLVVLANPEITRTINGTSNKFNYRKYNSIPDNVFCNDVPPSEIDISEDYQSSGGTVLIDTALVEDDGDGIPREVEDPDYFSGVSDTPKDTDGDGIPDYLDDDDDGDNVRTVTENPNYNEVDLLTNAQDTDNDGVADYLDDDDDNDGVLTRDEEFYTQNQNPTDDITNNTIGPDYLNNEVMESVPATAYREHTIKQTFEVRVTVQGLQLPNTSIQNFDFGVLGGYSGLSTDRDVTPSF